MSAKGAASGPPCADAVEQAPVPVLVHCGAPADGHQEELLRKGDPAPAEAQALWADMGDDAQVRSVMGLGDDTHQLTGAIELNEGFFETVDPGRDKDDPKKRGRGSQRQTTVPVMVGSRHNPDNRNRHRPDKKVKYLKMKVIENLRSETINEEVETGVETGTQVDTDDCSPYKKISPTIGHTAHKVNKTNLNKVLPWVHKAISNAKRLLLDVHHRIDGDFLENYLNEFCYKFNRRYVGGATKVCLYGQKFNPKI